MIIMSTRRKFLQSSAFSSVAVLFGKKAWANEENYPTIIGNPVVISTWDAGIAANKGAWEILGKGGRALDAVEAGVMVTGNWSLRVLS